MKTSELKDYWLKRNLDVQFCLDAGILFEINRHILHPLGIALIAKKKIDGTLYLSLKDSRERPEDLVYTKEEFAKASLKFENFMKAFGFEQSRKRAKKLGASGQFHYKRGG